MSYVILSIRNLFSISRINVFETKIETIYNQDCQALLRSKLALRCTIYITFVTLLNMVKDVDSIRNEFLTNTFWKYL